MVLLVDSSRLFQGGTRGCQRKQPSVLLKLVVAVVDRKVWLLKPVEVVGDSLACNGW